jgi:serpin B
MIGLAILLVQSCHSNRKAVKHQNLREATLSVEQLSESNNLFAMDLLRQVGPAEENLVFSPYSISRIMALVYGGARGETAGGMASVFYFPEDHALLHRAGMEITLSLDSVNLQPGTRLNVANAVWAQEDYDFLTSYIDLARDAYRAPVERVDFIHPENREKSRQGINNWVEEQTSKRIQNMINPGVLTSDTRLVLTNAIYFNGKWETPFEKDFTMPAVFHIDRNTSVRTPFMKQTSPFPYYEDEEIQAVSMPYKGGRTSLLIVLPKDIEGWQMISNILTPERLQVVISGLQTKKVRVILPRFKSELQLNLRKELISMGMEHAFSRDADLSGMTGEKELFISDVIHKAFIEVTEAGTEAAAATAAIIALKSALEEGPEVFRADHPFLYFLRDEPTGSIIFAGRLVRPAEIL